MAQLHMVENRTPNQKLGGMYLGFSWDCPICYKVITIGRQTANNKPTNNKPTTRNQQTVTTKRLKNQTKPPPPPPPPPPPQQQQQQQPQPQPQPKTTKKGKRREQRESWSNVCLALMGPKAPHFSMDRHKDHKESNCSLPTSSAQKIPKVHYKCIIYQNRKNEVLRIYMYIYIHCI